MCEIKCPYKPCGSNINCLGCIHDPEKRPMDIETFKDCNSHLGCGDCRFCDPKGDMDSIESPCKRIDHKHYQFAVPWFKSYDCGQLGHCICSDFEPKRSNLWLYRHWKPEFIKEYDKSPTSDETISLCIDKDQSVRYHINFKDFFYNTFKNKDGSLKWIYKMYYKRSKESAIGYKLVKEYNKEYNNAIKS